MARKQIRVWLDNRKGDEAWLLEQIPVAKKRRLFSRFVREGISLMVYLQEWGIKAQSVYDLLTELRAGETTKLFELFPHLKAKIATPPIPQDENKLDRIASMLEIVAAQQQTTLRMESTSLPPSTIAAKPQASSLKGIAPTTFAMPTFDDDDDLPTLKLSTNKSVNAAQNLINCVMGLNN